MIKNIIFDIGNVIINFDISYILQKFTEKEEEQKFILDNIINSPEWLEYGLIDTGYITKEVAIEIVKDRTNHINDSIIEKFWNHYNEYTSIDTDMLDLIRKLKNNNYNIYLLSNINQYMYDRVEPSGLFNMVDGFVFSYQIHKIKPYEGIYNELINKYKLQVNECLFIDDNIKNIETANKLGIAGNKVKPDDFNSVIDELKKFNINLK